MVRLLSEAEGMRDELKTMFAHIDSGEELDIDSIPSQTIKVYFFLSLCDGF